MSENNFPVVSDHLTVNVSGEPKELFMSFSLLQKLSKKFPDPQTIILLPIDPDAREIAFNVIFNVKSSEDLPDMSLNTAGEIIQWATGHLVNFFVTQTQQMVEGQKRLNPLMQTMLKRQEELNNQMSSTTGSTN